MRSYDFFSDKNFLRPEKINRKNIAIKLLTIKVVNTN
jgi:hypothetical protein